MLVLPAPSSHLTLTVGCIPTNSPDSEKLTMQGLNLQDGFHFRRGTQATYTPKVGLPNTLYTSSLIICQRKSEIHILSDYEIIKDTNRRHDGTVCEEGWEDIPAFGEHQLLHAQSHTHTSPAHIPRVLPPTRLHCISFWKFSLYTPSPHTKRVTTSSTHTKDLILCHGVCTPWSLAPFSSP